MTSGGRQECQENLVDFSLDLRIAKKMVMTTYILNPYSTFIIRYFKTLRFQEPCEGFMHFVFFMLSSKEFLTSGAAFVKTLVPSFLVLVICSFSLFFLFDLSTLLLS